MTGEPRIGFYAGAPLITPDGHAIGTLCVIDREPWTEFSDFAKDALQDYAGAIIDWLEADRQVRELTAENAKLKAELARRTP